jgi:hypothetical protein
MKQLLWLILIVFVVFPVIAQDDLADVAFEQLQVSNVRLRLSEEDGASLIFNASPAVCAPLIVDMRIDGEIIDLDAYAPPAEDNAACTMIVPFEPIIQLGHLEVDTFYKLFLNDFSTLFFLPRPNGIIMDVQFPMTWGEDNELFGFNRVDATIENVVFGISEANTITAQLSGYHSDGCITEEITSIRQDKLDSTLQYIELFRLIPEMVMCPAMLQEFDRAIDTGLSADEDTLFQIGEQFYSYDPEILTADEINRAFVMIESVDVQAVADGYEVEIFGTRNGDCGIDLRELVSETDFASFIQLFDDVPIQAVCTMDLVFYQNTFTVSTLPIIINAVAYDENGILLQANSQTSSPVNIGDENIIQSDTFIESVEVIVLESFPMQLHLVITGFQPEGCEFPVIVEQQRAENTVNVHIYREVPADVMCPMVIIPYEETVVLDGGFEFGTFTIQVNEFTVEIDL